MTDPNAEPNVPNVPPAPPAQPAPSYGTGAPAYSATTPSYGAPATQKTNVLAIVSLVSSFFISLVGIITGHIALSQIKRTGENGRGLAIAGLIIGYVYIAFIVLMVIIAIIVSVAAASAGYSSYSY